MGKDSRIFWARTWSGIGLAGWRVEVNAEEAGLALCIELGGEYGRRDKGNEYAADAWDTNSSYDNEGKMRAGRSSW
eukprot:7492397-Heterocapsa_arctica.AAC.1